MIKGRRYVRMSERTARAISPLPRGAGDGPDEFEVGSLSELSSLPWASRAIASGGFTGMSRLQDGGSTRLFAEFETASGRRAVQLAVLEGDGGEEVSALPEADGSGGPAEAARAVRRVP